MDMHTKNSFPVHGTRRGDRRSSFGFFIVVVRRVYDKSTQLALSSFFTRLFYPWAAEPTKALAGKKEEVVAVVAAEACASGLY
jgi:hypothetical protein